AVVLVASTELLHSLEGVLQIPEVAVQELLLLHEVEEHEPIEKSGRVCLCKAFGKTGDLLRKVLMLLGKAVIEPLRDVRRIKVAVDAVEDVGQVETLLVVLLREYQ